MEEQAILSKKYVITMILTCEQPLKFGRKFTIVYQGLKQVYFLENFACFIILIALRLNICDTDDQTCFSLH